MESYSKLEEEEGKVKRERLVITENNYLILCKQDSRRTWQHGDVLNFRYGIDGVIFHAITSALQSDGKLFLQEKGRNYYLVSGHLLEVIERLAKIWASLRELEDKIKFCEESQIVTNLTEKDYSVLIESLEKFLLKMKISGKRR